MHSQLRFQNNPFGEAGAKSRVLQLFWSLLSMDTAQYQFCKSTSDLARPGSDKSELEQPGDHGQHVWGWTDVHVENDDHKARRWDWPRKRATIMDKILGTNYKSPLPLIAKGQSTKLYSPIGDQSRSSEVEDNNYTHQEVTGPSPAASRLRGGQTVGFFRVFFSSFLLSSFHQRGPTNWKM